MSLFNVPQSTFQKVYQSFDRTEEDVMDDVAIVEAWLKTQPHLPEIMEKTKILNFLIMNKFSIEKSKQKIDMYYSIRSLCHWFDDANPKNPSLIQFEKNGHWVVHPTLLDDLYRVHFFEMQKPGTFAVQTSALQLFNIFEIRLNEDCMAGDVIVIDFTNFNLDDFLKVTLTETTKVFDIYQKVYSLRLKAIYFINSPPAVDIIVTVLKKVLKPKIFQRLSTSQDNSVLVNNVPKEFLPQNYGGKGPSIQQMRDLKNAKTIEYQKRYDELDRLRVNEKLRPQKLESGYDLGVYGNFKKLNID